MPGAAGGAAWVPAPFPPAALGVPGARTAEPVPAPGARNPLEGTPRAVGGALAPTVGALGAVAPGFCAERPADGCAGGVGRCGCCDPPAGVAGVARDMVLILYLCCV